MTIYRTTLTYNKERRKLMDFREIRKQAFVDETPTTIHPGATAAEVLRNQGQDTSNRSLVQQLSPTNKPRILNSEDKIDLTKGNQFHSQINASGG